MASDLIGTGAVSVDGPVLVEGGGVASGDPRSAPSGVAKAVPAGLDPTLIARVAAGTVVLAAISGAILAPARGLVAAFLAPVLLGALFPLGRWTDGTDRVNGLERYLEGCLARAKAGTGKLGRYFLRPLFTGTLGIWKITAPVSDSHVRAGLRVTLTLFFGALMLVALAIVGYLLLMIVIAVAMLVFTLKLMLEFLSDTLSGKPSGSSSGSGDEEEHRRQPPILGPRGTRVVQEGVFVDTPTGTAINGDGQIVREGFFVDTPTGQRIDEDGRLVDEGFFVDTPTGIRIREDGRVVEEGFFVDTSTKRRIDEDGRLVDEGFVVDIPTGTKFVKE